MRKGNLKHMQIAMGELGQHELKGEGNDNQRIIEYFKATTYHATDDEVPWCAAFVNWVLKQAGIARTKSAAALSFLDWGIRVTKPQYGDIGIIDRGHGRGHVFFYVGAAGSDRVKGLGGNQSDSVSVTTFDSSDVREYRRPKTAWDSTTVKVGAAGGIAGTLSAVVGSLAAPTQAVQDCGADFETMPDQLNTAVDVVTTVGTMLGASEIVTPVVMAVSLGYTIYERLRRLRLHNI